MLILIILICAGLLLAITFEATRSNSVLHVKTIKWPMVLLASAQAFILSLLIGWLAWIKLQNAPQQYPDFISGVVGFSNTSKTTEYYALLIGIAFFVVLFVLILKIYDLDDKEPEAKQGITKLSLYALVPSVIMAGQSLRMENTDTLLKISSAVIVLSLLVIVFLRLLLNKRVIDPEDVFRTGSKSMLVLVFWIASEFGMALFLPKFGILLSKALGFAGAKSGLSISRLGVGILNYQFGILLLLLVIIYTFLLLRYKERLDGFENKLDLGLALSQVGIPLLFSVLLSPPVIYRTGTITLFHYRPILFVLVFGLIMIGYVDLVRRFKNKKGNSLEYVISPWILVAILVYIQSISTNWPNIALDEYHFGEFYLPWWLFKQFGNLPYADFQPARGLVNYIPGLLSWLFYDDTFSGQSLIINHFSALYVFLIFFSLRKIVGNFVAFLSTASLFAYAGGPAGNLIVAIACLAILLKVSSDKKFFTAFCLWVGFSIFIPLFTIAEGSIFILGTLPLGIWLFFQSYRDSRKRLLIALGIFSMAGIVLIFTTNVELILISAVRYLLEEAGVNDVANGIVWRRPQEISSLVTFGYLWQFLRFSWLLLLIPLLARLVNNKETVQERLFLIGMFIICILLIPRAAGRIDANDFSRPGLTSFTMIFCALPLIILPPIKNDLHKAIVILLFALFLGLLGSQELYAKNAMSLPKQVISEPDVKLFTKKTGLSNIGNKALINDIQLKRQVGIRKVLNQLLAPQETYFDATNHVANYGFQGRPSPVSVPAVYNASSIPVQQRMIDQLEEKQVPLVLLSTVQEASDGGTISFRNYAIYDYLLKNYLPFQDKLGYVWMIRKGEEKRLAKTKYKVGSNEENLALLNSLLWQEDLLGLPASWGNSIQSLSNRMTNPQDILENGAVESTHSLQELENGDWQVSGPDPFIVFSVPTGAHGDLLLMEMSQKITGGPMRIFWETSLVPDFQETDNFSFETNSSRFIIPLSSAPSWHLSDNVRNIRIDFPNNYKGVIHFNNLTLFDRALE